MDIPLCKILCVFANSQWESDYYVLFRSRKIRSEYVRNSRQKWRLWHRRRRSYAAAPSCGADIALSELLMPGRCTVITSSTNKSCAVSVRDLLASNILLFCRKRGLMEFTSCIGAYIIGSQQNVPTVWSGSNMCNSSVRPCVIYMHHSGHCDWCEVGRTRKSAHTTLFLSDSGRKHSLYRRLVGRGEFEGRYSATVCSNNAVSNYRYDNSWYYTALVVLVNIVVNNEHNR